VQFYLLAGCRLLVLEFPFELLKSVAAVLYDDMKNCEYEVFLEILSLLWCMKNVCQFKTWGSKKSRLIISGFEVFNPSFEKRN
jgi:hypothetical protein